MVQIYSGNSGNQRRAGPMTAILFVIIGLGMLWGAYYFGMKTQELVSHGLHAKGTIVDVQQKLETRTRHRQGYGDVTSQQMMYYPIVKFADNQNHDVQFKSQMGSSSNSRHKGDIVEILYLENDPQGSAIIDEGALNWLIPGIFGSLGAIFTLAGAFTFMRALAV